MNQRPDLLYEKLFYNNCKITEERQNPTTGRVFHVHVPFRSIRNRFGQSLKVFYRERNIKKLELTSGAMTTAQDLLWDKGNRRKKQERVNCSRKQTNVASIGGGWAKERSLPVDPHVNHVPIMHVLLKPAYFRLFFSPLIFSPSI